MIPKVGLMEVQTAELKKSNVASNALRLNCEGDECSFAGSQAAPQKAEAKQGGLNLVKVGLASAVGAGLGFVASRLRAPKENIQHLADVYKSVYESISKMSAKQFADVAVNKSTYYLDKAKTVTMQNAEEQLSGQISDWQKQLKDLPTEADREGIQKALDEAKKDIEPLREEFKANPKQVVTGEQVQALERQIAQHTEDLENITLRKETEQFIAQAEKDLAELQAENTEKLNVAKNQMKKAGKEKLAEMKKLFVNKQLEVMDEKGISALYQKIEKQASSKKPLLIGAAVVGLGYAAYEKLVKKA